MKNAVMNWSGGKDSALCLFNAIQSGEFRVQSLITSVSKEHGRITMHGVRRELLESQASAIGLPLEVLELASDESMESYNAMMSAMFARARSRGITHSIYGDIFLEDLKAYRDSQLATVNIAGAYPLWQRNTRDVIDEFLYLGFRAVIVCGEEQKCPKEFVGEELSRELIAELPKGTDPCGENGEFHSFVFDGPLFNRPLLFERGELSYQNYTPKAQTPPQNGFYFRDLIPKL